MPQSVFVQARRAANDPYLAELAAAREELIANTVLDPAGLPVSASTCYVWPAASCPVGCGHCNFAAPPEVASLSRSIVGSVADRVIRIASQMGLWKAVLSGGGEPMIEPAFCQRFIREVDSPGLAEIELITSAHFATTGSAAREALQALVDAWRDRPATGRPHFTIRISLDWFHEQRIGVGPAATVIRLLGEPEFRDVGCYVRSVLLEHDQTILKLAAALDGTLSDIADYRQTLSLPDGREILVYFKNLIIDGRMNQRKLSRLPVGLAADSRVQRFGQRFLNERGKHVPARVYNGPEVKHLDGLACIIEDDGAIKILEGNDPNRAPNVRGVRSWAEALGYLYADPLTAFLVEQGPVELAGLILDVFPEVESALSESNQLYYLTDQILASPAHTLLATLRVVEQQIAVGRSTSNAGVLDRCWTMLARRYDVSRAGVMTALAASS